MAHSYHITSRIRATPKKPSNLGSGLGESVLSALLGGPTPVSEVPSPQDGNPGPERKRKVIVVGAGISGLRAASVLQRHGVEVIVLEGRDRLGGRIHTTRTEKGVRDIGAAWMHETSQNKLVRLVPRLGIECYYDDGLGLYFTDQGRAGAQFKAKKVADEFADHCEWYYGNRPHAPDRSVAEFARDFVAQHELISDDERAWAPQALKEVELWIGTSVELASAKHLSYFITERNLYMKGGYDGIVNWVARPLLEQPGAIRLNNVVRHVAWSEDGADACVVEYCDGDGLVHEIEADAVVLTAPLGVLHHRLIGFDPPLPADLQLGISRLSYGALGKVFFEFADVFWSKDHDQFIYYPSPPELDDDGLHPSSLGSSSSSSRSSAGAGAEDNILHYATVTINLWIMTNSKQLCVQIAEPLTQRIEAMACPRALYRFFEPLFRLFRTEPSKALPRLVSLECTHWTQDPLAGYGSYSADKVGDDPALWLAALRRHRASRLQFAGEHCTAVANGCVHGAFATGEAAAKNLLDAFALPYDGGDFVTLDPTHVV